MISALTAAVLWWNLVPSVGAVEVEHYSWDLAFGGQSVGQRDLTVKYRSDGVAEVRILESWTELVVSLGKDEFTRADVAAALNVDRKELRDSFKAARKGGHLSKVRTDDNGKRYFKLGE